ncbi:MAG TPA: tRNA pseudouridine(55) synthase TruB [Bacteroidia bacterium]|nr:tRNA pseudouridine(55) synthase TruB [Bacteroidia bacterium]
MIETKNNFLARGGTVILINKPLGWTSFDVVKKVRNILAPPRTSFKGEEEQSVRFKVGHAGTLDPLATGLLIICTDRMTRKISEFQELEKEYTGTFVLGATTPSYDLETEISKGKDFSNLTKKMLRDAAKHFTGKILQAAPLHSAKKIEGVRAYEIARKGGEAQMKPVAVSIHSFEITEIDLPNVSFKVVCSKGTYIRSLANDFGKHLECGAYLSSLTRTRIGEYKVEDAMTPEEFEKEVLLAADSQIEKEN